MTRERNVGGMGEDDLLHWADEVGIIANKAERDRAGYDYHLDFPIRYSEAVPIDKEHVQQCRVQVKSSDQQRRYIDLTLSNWKRLVDTPLPAFFLILHYDGKERPQKAFLRHVWEGEMEHVLRRLRQVHSSGLVAALHKKTLRLRYSDEHALTSLNGPGLTAALQHHIGSNLGEYAANKLLLRKRLGYVSTPD